MPKKELMERYLNIPHDQWKVYAVPVMEKDWAHCFCWYYISAPNKTIARYFVAKETRGWHRDIRGKVVEVPDQ